MRPLSTILLLSILAFAGACSKSNYAQVEPDDLYFTHKDRKASQAYGTTSASATADAAYNYSAADVSSYTNQHSPALYSRELGSPTIQLNEQSFYDASQNPDYLLGQNVASVGGVSDVYYSDDYASYDAVVTEDVPQTVNNYYGYPNYASNYPRWGSPYSSLYYSPAVSLRISYGFGFGYGYGGYGYRPYRNYAYYGYPDYYYGYPGYYSNYAYYGNSYAYCPPYYGSGYSGNNYSNNDGVYYGSNVTNNYGSSSSNYTTKPLNDDGTKVNGPRVSRSSVSYYANKSNYDVIRRDNNKPGSEGNEGGRIASDENESRYTPVNRSGSSTIVRSRNLQAGDLVNRRQSAGQSSGTIQRNNTNANSRYNSSTIRQANNSRSRNSATINRANQRQKTYVNRSSNGRSSTINRSSNRQSINNNANRSGRSSYSSPSRSSSNSSYNRSRSNSSYRSSGSRSGYSPRSSSMSRSSSSRSSAAPSRSSSSRSSATRSSSGSSSRSSASKRKN